MRALGAAATFALLLSTAAQAGGTADGNAGLDALNHGSYDEAVRLFTRALSDRTLLTDDREFAYLCRGKAFMAKGDRAAGTKDLEEAVRLKPSDTEALAQLQLALGGDRSSPGITTPSAGARDPWGMLSNMTGKYYWYQLPGQDPHIAYEYISWILQGQTLSVLVRTKHATVAADEIKLDPVTNKLIEADIAKSAVMYSTETVGSESATGYGYSQAQPWRTTSRMQSDGSIIEVSEKFGNGSWTENARVTLVEVPKETLQSEGFVKR